MARRLANGCSIQTRCMTDPLEDLAKADEAVREAEAAVEGIGEDRLRQLEEAYDRMTDMLARYEGPASGSGRETFQAYVEFEGTVSTFVENLPDDLPEREPFERVVDQLDKRYLDEGDFERARETLSPVAELVDRLDDQAAAREQYRRARGNVERRIRELGDQIDSLEAVLAFEDVDMDAPVEELRGPIEEYNEGVRDAFASYRRTASARSVLELVAVTRSFPLVTLPRPPEELQTYLDSSPVGEESVQTLLDYADYSRSKLEHFVDEPATFMARVAANRSYLRRLDATPLTIDWPPPPAEDLRWRTRELVSVVDRFAPDRVVSLVHELRSLSRAPDYERLRQAARAREELDEEDRRRLADGSLKRELQEVREERDRLQNALEEYPDR